jgi:hypothetical protein
MAAQQQRPRLSGCTAQLLIEQRAVHVPGGGQVAAGEVVQPQRLAPGRGLALNTAAKIPGSNCTGISAAEK